MTTLLYLFVLVTISSAEKIKASEAVQRVSDLCKQLNETVVPIVRQFSAKEIDEDLMIRLLHQKSGSIIGQINSVVTQMVINSNDDEKLFYKAWMYLNSILGSLEDAFGNELYERKAFEYYNRIQDIKRVIREVEYNI